MHPALQPGAPFPATLTATELPGLPIFSRGKVREMIDHSYELVAKKR